MKPRRWYSSPEINPHPHPPPVRPVANQLHWYYTSKVRINRGPVLQKRTGPHHLVARFLPTFFFA
jgi:hypothetical protein